MEMRYPCAYPNKFCISSLSSQIRCFWSLKMLALYFCVDNKYTVSETLMSKCKN